MDAIAHFLSVTPSQITNGEMGPVHCNGSLTVVDIEAHAPGTAVEVRGTIGPCLTVGLTKAPEPRKRYTDLLVICPGPVEEPSVGA